MPTIRMKTTTEKPVRRKGKLYDVPFPESWELVRDGLAEHEYVPESKLDVLTASEPKSEPKKAG